MARPPKAADDGAESPHYLAHRRRLKARFLKAGAEALQDYEIIELLLFAAIHRRDVKPVAKRLLKRFGSLGAVLSAPPERLCEVTGIGEASVVALKVVQAAALALMREEITGRPVLGSWDRVVGYCRAAMAHEAAEQFRILFLDNRNALIADEVQQKGTVDHTPVYPREVVKRALELGAAALIMVHNHPSGDTTPSAADIEMTRQVESAAKAVGLTLHDHFIVGRAGYTSFKSKGLL